MENVQQSGKIENVGLVDLTGMTADDLANISSIENVGVILVPESLAGALLKVPQSNTAMTVTIPQTALGKIKVLTGQLTLGGDAFSNASGSSDDILVLAGQIMITSSIEKIGYKEVIVAGQLIAPKASEGILSTAISKLAGQTVYYNSEPVKVFLGNDTFTKDFFDLIDGKITMILTGNVELDSSVDVITVKNKVSEFIITGSLSAPKALVPLLQMLVTVNLGKIIGKEDEAVQSGQ